MQYKHIYYKKLLLKFFVFLIKIRRISRAQADWGTTMTSALRQRCQRTLIFIYKFNNFCTVPKYFVWFLTDLRRFLLVLSVRPAATRPSAESCARPVARTCAGRLLVVWICFRIAVFALTASNSAALGPWVCGEVS